MLDGLDFSNGSCIWFCSLKVRVRVFALEKDFQYNKTFLYPLETEAELCQKALKPFISGCKGGEEKYL